MGCGGSKSSNRGASGPISVEKNGIYVEPIQEIYQDDEYDGPTEPEDYDFNEGEIPLKRFVLSTEEVYALPHNLQAMQRMYQASLASAKELPDPELRPPPLTNKADVLSKVNLRKLDARADKCPLEIALAGFSDLVQHLTSGLKSEVEAVRVFFRWMAVTAGNSEVDSMYEDQDCTNEDPLYYLQGIRQGKGINYVILLHKLLYEVGIVAEVIRGVTKSAQYKIGHFVNTSHSSVWLAVLIEDQWRFIDPIWACQVLQGYDSGEWNKVDENLGLSDDRQEQHGSLGFKINEFYFLTDPQYSILEHFPYDPRWQLLPRQLTLQEFEEMPYCEPEEMERLGVEIVSHPKCVFEIKDSAVSAQEKKLRLHIKKGQDNTLEFTEETDDFNVFSAQLYIHSSSINSEETGDVIQYKAKKWQLQHFCVTGHSVKLKQLFVTVIPPVAGKFLLKLFGARCSDESMKHVISYVFHCRQTAEVVPIPPGNLTEWGPGGQTAEAGLTPLTHPEPIIEMQKGETTIRFHTKNLHLRYSIKLSSTDDSIRLVEQFAIHWKENDQAVIKVRTPKEGLYALYISCHLPKGGTVPICEYLLDGQVPCVDPNHPYPRLKDKQFLGHDNKVCEKLSTNPQSHQFGYFETSSKTIKIVWDMNKQVIFCTTMFLQDERGHQDYSQFVLVETSPSQKKAFINVKFPQVGYYLLNISGLGDEESNVQSLCNYVIKVFGEPYMNALPYPKPSVHWQKGFKLMNPETSYLEPNTYVQIVVKVEKGIEVENLEIRSEKPLMMLYLQCDGQSDGFWKSTIDAGPPGTKWSLNITTKDKKLEGHLIDFTAIDSKEKAEWDKKHEEYANLYDKVKLMRIEYSKWLDELDERLKKQTMTVDDILEKEKQQALDETESAEELDPESIVDLLAEAKNQERLAQQIEDPEEQNKRKEIAKQLSERVLKSKMRAAIRKEDVDKIKETLIEFESAGIEDGNLVDLAKQTIVIAEIKTSLREAELQAIKQRSSTSLKRIIERAQASEYKGHIEKLLKESLKVLARVERLEHLYKRILSLDKKTIAELRTYSNPKTNIVDIIRATLLLLGEYEKRTSTWMRCKPYLNPTSKVHLQQQINNFQPENLHPAIAARAKVILQPYKEEDAVQVSAAAAAFYAWSMGVITDKEETSDPRQFFPANLERQRKILHVSKEEHNQLLWADEKK